MKLIIAGSRDFSDYELLKKKTINFIHDRIPSFIFPCQVQIISGMAKGADRLGEKFAEEHGLILLQKPANWNLHGRSAGYKRNEEMAQAATHCIVFWDGKSAGTKHMIDLAKKYKLDLEVIMYG